MENINKTLGKMAIIMYNLRVQGNRLTARLFEDFCQFSSNGKTSLRRNPVTNLASGFPEQKLAKGVAGFLFMAKEIVLTNGQVAIVDDDDYLKLIDRHWQAIFRKRYRGGGYVAMHYSQNAPAIFMHREIMNAQEGEQVDHIDRNPLNNQKANLRIVTASQNGMNKGLQANNQSGYKGVYFHKGKQRFRAQIRANGVKYELGSYRNAEDAARAYNEAAIRLHGEYAVLNEIEDKADHSAHSFSYFSRQSVSIA